MIEHIKTFFDSLLGASLPDVCYVIIALSLVYLILRGFLKIFKFEIKIPDYAFYVTVAVIALSSLGGFVWNISLS